MQKMVVHAMSRMAWLWAINRTTLITLLRVAFGSVWLLNGLMKVFGLAPDNITDIVRQASQGQPAWLQPWFSFWTNIISSNPAFMLNGIRVLELALGFTLILGFMRKLSYLSGILLSLIIWTVAEGFGGPYGPGSTDIGAAILYPFVFFALIVLETSPGSNKYSLDKLVERYIGSWSKNSDDIHKGNSGGILHTAADFQCFVCGAVFTTDEDRRRHLEKEAHGKLRDGTTKEEMDIALDQEELNES